MNINVLLEGKNIMELRVLNYFLVIAREENITKAAKLLNLTQPTLSRQMKLLEEELGVKLFRRREHSIYLTEEGELLRYRAQKMIDLSETIREDFAAGEETAFGKISMGCAEAKGMSLLARQMRAFQDKHPLVRFHVFSASADDVKEKLNKGILDIGLLAEPVDVGGYEYLRISEKDRWGVLVRQDSPLASREFVTPEDLREMPLIIPPRKVVRSEWASWFGEYYDHLEIVATYNLILNAAAMVKERLGICLCLGLGTFYEELKFIPLSPPVETGTVLVWKKNRDYPSAVSRFIRHIRDHLHAETE